MTDGHDRNYEAGVDREIDVRALVYGTAGLVIIVIVFAALMWWLSVGLRDWLVASDPPLPVLPEARIQELPPEPRLQTSPEADLRALRREEDAILGGYRWIDEGAGVAQIPIERAMEMMAQGIEAAPAEAAPGEGGS